MKGGPGITTFEQKHLIMKDRSKQIFSIIITLVLIFTGIYIISLFGNPDGEYHRSSIFGALVGLILIRFYQNYFIGNWVYNARLLLNAVAIGLGYLLWTILELITKGLDSSSLKTLLMESLMGFAFGLFIGLYQFFTNLYRKKKTPFGGNEELMVNSSAYIIYSSGTVSGKGRAILLRDQLIFLTPGSPEQSLLLKDIRNIEVGRTLGFPNKLILFLDGAESMALSVSMPQYWKNKIEKLS